MPQAYFEVGYNDWDIKMGHFYTPMGYEVFPANGQLLLQPFVVVVQQRADYPHRRVGHLHRRMTARPTTVGYTARLGYSLRSRSTAAATSWAVSPRS